MADPGQQSFPSAGTTLPDRDEVARDSVVRRYCQLWDAGVPPEVRTFVQQAGPLTPEQMLTILEVDQTNRWRRGERPRVESYLQLFPQLAEDRRVLALVRSEVNLCQAHGEPIDMDELNKRFPEYAADLAKLSADPDAGTVADLAIESAGNTPRSGGEPAKDGPTTVRLRPGWEAAPPEHVLRDPLAETFANSWPRGADGASPAAIQHPRAIGPYDVQQVLNHGGMGVVYKALDTRLKRPVAVKMILAGAHADPATLARFRGEAEAVALLQHANIVQIYEVGEHLGLPYLAFEFVDGKNLQRIIAERTFTPRESALLVLTLARAVEFAHQRGIIHRDLKPGNILITQQGVPKITDFGLAKLKGSRDTHTRPGEVIGTPNYMAPEQAEGDPQLVGPGADVYSLGAVLYELITGQPPFHGTSPMETLLRLRLHDPIAPRRLQPKVPADLETICLKCLRKERDARYASAEQLAEDLQRFLDGRPIQARPTNFVERGWKWSQRHPASALLALGLVACLAISYGVVLVQWNDLRDARKELSEQSSALTATRADLNKERLAVAAERQSADEARLKAEWISYLAQLNEAEREFTTYAAAKARALLDQCHPDLRSWEWHYLRRRLDGSAVTVPLRPGERMALSLLPGDREAVTITTDARVIRRTLASGSESGDAKLAWSDDQHVVDAVANRAVFSADAALIAADCLVRPSRGSETAHYLAVWNTATARLVHAWPIGTDTPLKLAFRADGRRLAMITGNWREQRGRGEWLGGELSVFDLDNGDSRHSWQVPIASDKPSYLDVAFDSEKSRLVLTQPHSALIFVDADSGQFIKEIKAADARGGVCVSPVGPVRFGFRNGATVTLYDKDGGPLGTLNGHAGIITQASFSENGRLLLTAATDHTVRVWDVATRKATAVLVGHTLSVNATVMGGSGQFVVSTGQDGQFKVWDLTLESPLSMDTGTNREWTPSVVFGPDSKWLISGSGDGEIIRWDIASRKRLKSYDHPGSVMALALTRDGKTLAVGTSNPRDLTLMNPLTGQVFKRLEPGEMVITLNFLADEKRLLVTGNNGLAAIWDVDSGAMIARLNDHHGTVLAGACSPRGDLVATGGADGVIRLWSAGNPQQVRTIPAHETQVSCLAFSPDGRRLASANRNRDRSNVPAVIRIWDVETGKLLRELNGHDQSVWCLTWHPDGKRLASGSEDKTVKIWEPTQGQMLLTLKGHTDDVRCVAFSRDGWLLVSSNDDSLIRLWDATPIAK